MAVVATVRSNPVIKNFHARLPARGKTLNRPSPPPCASCS
jgi:hypothetical protein